MNLYARTLGIPLHLHDAVDALGTATVRNADIATMNARAFVHQFSIGLHPKAIEARQAYSYSSRVSKIIASARAALDAFRRVPRFAVELTLDGVRAGTRELSVLACANNRYGPGHLPYADVIDGGELGLYLARPLNPRESISLTADLFLGTWPGSELLRESTHREVHVRVRKASRRAKCIIDGELLALPETISLKTHPGALKVLVPAPSAAR